MPLYFKYSRLRRLLRFAAKKVFFIAGNIDNIRIPVIANEVKQSRSQQDCFTQRSLRCARDDGYTVCTVGFILVNRIAHNAGLMLAMTVYELLGSMSSCV